MRNVLNTCFTKLVAVLSDEVLDRWHQTIEVERYRRLLNQRKSIESHTGDGNVPSRTARSQHSN
jgi:hypothetical protein